MPDCQANDNLPAVVQWQRKHATEDGSTDAVYACATHAISLALAALLHENSCAAPAAACDCTPTPLPTAPADPEPDPVQLPAGW